MGYVSVLGRGVLLKNHNTKKAYKSMISEFGVKAQLSILGWKIHLHAKTCLCMHTNQNWDNPLNLCWTASLNCPGWPAHDPDLRCQIKIRTGCQKVKHMGTVNGNTILSLTRKCVVMKTSECPPTNRAPAQKADYSVQRHWLYLDLCPLDYGSSH